MVEGPPRRHRAHARRGADRPDRVVAGARRTDARRKAGKTTGWGAPFEWTWLVLQWPLVFVLVATGIGLIYYFGPDADQDWAWITPGAVAATILWLVVSLLFKIYVANFTDYEGSYGTVGGVIVVLLWFYVSGIAILTGAELNAEIEHASPYGKAPGQKNAQGKLLIGARAERAFRSGSSLGSRSLSSRLHRRRRHRRSLDWVRRSPVRS